MRRNKSNIAWFIFSSILFILVFTLIYGCSQKEKSTAIIDKKILKAEITKISETAHGALGIAGMGEDKIHILKVWGTPYEMGKAHGMLMKKEITEHLPNLIRIMVEKSGQPVSLLDEVYKTTKPFIPERFIEEMRGIADATGLPLNDVIRANLIGEAGEWHCSLFGAWGKATAADGHLYQLRSLDYETRANIQNHPVMVVYFPDNGHPYANITWAGVVGCISGISSERLAISEIGDDYDKDNDSFAGIPFMFLLRDILQFDKSLDAAINRVNNASRTTSLLYGIGDGEMGQLRGLQTSHTICNVYDPDNLEPLTKTHQRIEDIVYWGMSWDVPAYDGPLHDKLIEHYGKINAEVTINDIVTSVKTGNLQTIVYDLTAMKTWVANARADDETGPLAAYDRQFVEFDMPELFKR
jgi:isopenicillin-N N-acyltransferase-like protein